MALGSVSSTKKKKKSQDRKDTAIAWSGDRLSEEFNLSQPAFNHFLNGDSEKPIMVL
jgi:hypothetical protein